MYISQLLLMKTLLVLRLHKLQILEKRQAELSDKLRSGWPTAVFTLGVVLTC